MKNILIGIAVAIILVTGGWFIINGQTGSADIDVNDEFGQGYNIANHIYVPINPDTVIEKLENDESFILFIGRTSCPYCQQTVPALNDAAVNFGYDEIYYMNSELEENYAFLDANQIDAVPFTAFIKDGVSVMVVPGYVESSVFEEILTEIA